MHEVRRAVEHGRPRRWRLRRRGGFRGRHCLGNHQEAVSTVLMMSRATLVQTMDLEAVQHAEVASTLCRCRDWLYLAPRYSGVEAHLIQAADCASFRAFCYV